MISIIVPVYNVEKYLDSCVNSIINQTYTDLEIILINDGSTDSSGKICDFWARKDNRVTVFHKKNGGLMSAWKHGFLKSKGDFIGFVDSDDWIDKDMYEILYNRIFEENSDIVLCGLIKEYENNSSREFEKIILKNQTYNEEEIRDLIFPIAIASGKSPSRGISPNRVTKLFIRKIVEQIIPFCDDNITIGEDLLSIFTALIFSRRISVINNFFPYHYRINSNSMIRKFTKEKYDKIKSLNKEMLNINKISKHDFSRQLNLDYVDLILSLFEEEILHEKFNQHVLFKNISDEYNDKIFQDSLKNIEINKLAFKKRVYIYLLKNNQIDLFILLRKYIRRI